jgi:hypothetical protein
MNPPEEKEENNHSHPPKRHAQKNPDGSNPPNEYPCSYANKKPTQAIEMRRRQ